MTSNRIFSGSKHSHLSPKLKYVIREQKLGNSKPDFLVGKTYIEVKTPLQSLQIELRDHIATTKASELDSVERFVKHISELAKNTDEVQC